MREHTLLRPESGPTAHTLGALRALVERLVAIEFTTTPRNAPIEAHHARATAWMEARALLGVTLYLRLGGVVHRVFMERYARQGHPRALAA